jgi:NADH-quinone oxidoreductase subunit M
MIPVLLILIPLIAGFVSFFIKNESSVKPWVLATSLFTLIISVLGLTVFTENKFLHHQCEWMQPLGSSFSVGMDGMGQLLCLLNAIAYPLVILATWKSSYKKANNFFALMLLLGAGTYTDVFFMFSMGW